MSSNCPACCELAIANCGVCHLILPALSRRLAAPQHSAHWIHMLLTVPGLCPAQPAHWLTTCAGRVQSMTGVAVKTLQQALPEACVLYSSATGASGVLPAHPAS